MLHRNITILCALTVCGLAGSVPQQNATRDSVEESVNDGIKATLNAQVKAWNNGDIRGFMAGYVNSDQLRFASGNSVSFGWSKTLKRYEDRYPDRDTMGTLTFRDLKILPLSAQYAEVFGKWHLARKNSIGDAEGLFTLLMQKTDKGWQVFHDHTSAATTNE
jgi:ketosteroid isomerase-like protein